MGAGAGWAALGLCDLARQQLTRFAQVDALDDWRFSGWFRGRWLMPMGMAGQGWNAAAFQLARLPLLAGDGVWGSAGRGPRPAYRSVRRVVRPSIEGVRSQTRGLLRVRRTAAAAYGAAWAEVRFDPYWTAGGCGDNGRRPGPSRPR